MTAAYRPYCCTVTLGAASDGAGGSPACAVGTTCCVILPERLGRRPEGSREFGLPSAEGGALKKDVSVK